MNPASGTNLPFLTSRDTARVARERLETLTREVASGQAADTGRALSSDFSQVSRLSHRLRAGDALAESLSFGATWGSALQVSLERIGDASARVAAVLPAALSRPGAEGVALAAEVARGAALDIGAALQVQVNGRALFANGAADAPLPDVGAVLADVDALAGSATDYAAYASAVDAYFAPGGDFRTTRLTGWPAGPARFPSGEGQTIGFDIDAADEAIVTAFRQTMLVAGLGQAGFDVGAGGGSAMQLDIQGRIFGAANGLPGLQARIGDTEARIAARSDALMQDRTTTEMALSDLLGVDPYEATTRLQDEMTRLEALYAITARRSQLRLTDYLR